MEFRIVEGHASEDGVQFRSKRFISSACRVKGKIETTVNKVEDVDIEDKSPKGFVAFIIVFAFFVLLVAVLCRFLPIWLRLIPVLLFIWLFISTRTPAKGYHGAEHQVHNAYTKGKLTLEEAKKQSQYSKGCGSILLSFVLYAYLLIAFSPSGKNLDTIIVLSLLLLTQFPQLWVVQWLNVRKAEDQELEVAIAALKALIEKEQSARDK